MYRVLEQRCREWGVPLYLSTIDFTKAFDSIKHSSIWKSLRHYGVKPAYVRLLQRLYSQQEGSVLTDKESIGFPIKKGTKQGDPLSSLLFNTVLQYSLEENLKSWQENKKGIRLSDATEDCLTNLRFADDVLLFSTSLKKLRDMLCDFKASTEKVGLGIHPDKTKILSNQDKVKAKELSVDNIQIEILKKSDSARYLGQKITFQDQEMEEIKNRLKAAWAAFHKYRQELTSRDYRLCHRLRLFNMVITPTMTYASGTWTLTKKHEQMIRKAQRKMLRLIIQTKRKYKKWERTSNKKKEEMPEGKKMKTTRIYLTKKRKTTYKKTQTKTRTAMYPLRKKRMKKLMKPKMKKTGSHSSKEVLKRLNNTWKSINYLVGLKYIEEQNGEWQEE